MAISLQDLAELRKSKAKKHKFGAVRCEIDGKKFPSRLERSCYETLILLQAAKKILFFLRQVAFDLPGNHRHFVDFQVFTPDEVIFIESKGRDLSVGKLKREQAEEIYGVQIFVAKKPEDIKKIILGVK